MKIKGVFAAPFLMIVVLALFGTASLLQTDNPAVVGNPYLTLTVVQLIVYALPALFFCRMRGKGYTPRLRLRFFAPGQLFLLVFALLAMLSGSALLNLLMVSLFPEGDFSGTSAAAVSGDVFQMLYVILALCILPALLEEFLFRGIMTAEYESVSVPCAVCMSSLLFAMMHLSFVRLPAYFFSGIILALTMYATRSVFASMVVHAANNVAALWLERYFYTAAAETGDSGILLVFVLLCVLFLSLILFAASAQRIYTNYGVNNTPSPYVHKRKRGDTGAVEAFTAPPFLLLVVLFIIFTAVS